MNNSQSQNSTGTIINISQLFNNIRDAFTESIQDHSIKDSAISSVTELEKAVGTPDYNNKFRDFISQTATWMTVLTPFMLALAQLITP